MAEKTNLTAHPVAALFPMLEGADYEALKADIRQNGQLQPIVIHPEDGSIIDGRNRYRACIELGLEPRFETWAGSGSVVEAALSLNLHRRHMNSSQRAMVALEVLPLMAQEARARQKNAGRNHGRGKVPEQIPEAITSRGEAREQAAKIANTNPRYVSDAAKIAQEAPQLAQAIKAGALTITEAKRALKEQEREGRRLDNAAKVATSTAQGLPIEAALGRFSTILIDPPWDWGDEGDGDQLGRARPDYATMALEDIAALPVGQLAAGDAHLYLWITNRSLFKGAALIESWGFRYITAITWGKPTYGLGNYYRGQTEHLLFGVRGSLPLQRKDAGTLLLAPRGPGGHSSKPAEVYSLIESASPGPHLELFARETRAGWYSWGEDGLRGGGEG